VPVIGINEFLLYYTITRLGKQYILSTGAHTILCTTAQICVIYRFCCHVSMLPVPVGLQIYSTGARTVDAAHNYYDSDVEVELPLIPEHLQVETNLNWKIIAFIMISANIPFARVL